MYSSFMRCPVSFQFNNMCKIILLVVLSVMVCVPYTSSYEIKSKYPSNRMLDFDWPEPDPSIKKIPHEEYCHYYYNRESEDLFTVRKCPKGEMFDYHVHDCRKNDLAQCWSRHYGKHAIHDHIHSKWRKHFKCPFPEGNYPDIFDCNKYIVCMDGEPHHKHCAPFKQFDKIRRHCVHVAVCANITDKALVSHMCPYSSGKFAHPYDCSLYYNCHESEPSLVRCGDNKLFDEERRHCKDKKLVSCGTRNNPYEKQVNHKETKNDVTAKGDDLRNDITVLSENMETRNAANAITRKNTTKTNSIVSIHTRVSQSTEQSGATDRSPNPLKNTAAEPTVKSGATDKSQNGLKISALTLGLEKESQTTQKSDETTTPDITVRTEVINNSKNSEKTNKPESKVPPVTVAKSQTSVETIVSESSKEPKVADKSQISTKSADPKVVEHTGSTFSLPISVKTTVNESIVPNSTLGSETTTKAS